MATLKIMYYLGGFTVVGYFLMKVVERDPENLRKELPEKHELDYEAASQKRTAAFMQVLRNSAAGDNPEEAVRKLKSQMEKTTKTS